MTFWTDQKVQDALRYIDEGYTITQTAKMIGAPSRNIVAGKLHRMGVRCNPKVYTKDPYVYTIPPTRGSGTKVQGVSLLDLDACQCRWPVYENKEEFLFCGVATKGHSPYCEAHSALAYETGEDDG